MILTLGFLPFISIFNRHFCRTFLGDAFGNYIFPHDILLWLQFEVSSDVENQGEANQNHQGLKQKEIYGQNIL